MCLARQAPLAALTLVLLGGVRAGIASIMVREMLQTILNAVIFPSEWLMPITVVVVRVQAITYDIFGLVILFFSLN